MTPSNDIVQRGIQMSDSESAVGVGCTPRVV